MEKERERQYNGSYLYKLNEELSGQAELDPYFLASALEPEEQDGYEDTNYTEPSDEEDTLS